jgi:ppGpp synthetase/RelA/SpoT-type nucleotidyltranferase
MMHEVYIYNEVNDCKDVLVFSDNQWKYISMLQAEIEKLNAENTRITEAWEQLVTEHKEFRERMKGLEKKLKSNNETESCSVHDLEARIKSLTEALEKAESKAIIVMESAQDLLDDLMGINQQIAEGKDIARKALEAKG